MKKLIFTTLMAGLAGIAMVSAQKVEPKSGLLKGAQPTNQAPKLNSSKAYGKSSIESWFSYPDMLSEAQIINVPAQGGGTVVFINHDSLAKFVTEGDTIQYDNVYLCTGSVYDPKDDIIDLSTSHGSDKFSKYTNYDLDSIAFAYLYVRYQDSIVDQNTAENVPVVDTLFVYYYQGSALNYRGDATAGRFSYANYNQTTRYPQAPTRVDTILLTLNDTTEKPDETEQSWATKYYVHGLTTPLTINPTRNPTIQNTVGVFFAFKSGLVYDTSYTMIHQGSAATAPAPDKRINYFGIRLVVDGNTTKYLNPDFYNSSVITSVRNGYPQTQYLAMQPTSLNGFYQDIQLFLTSGTVGVADIKNDNFAMSNVYPNPATVNGSAVMAFSLKTASTVSVNIYNIAGQQVKTAINKNFAAGDHTEEFDLAGLKPGIYMVNMTVNGVSSTKKLTITE